MRWRWVISCPSSFHRNRYEPQADALISLLLSATVNLAWLTPSGNKNKPLICGFIIKITFLTLRCLKMDHHWPLGHFMLLPNCSRKSIGNDNDVFRCIAMFHGSVWTPSLRYIYMGDGILISLASFPLWGGVFKVKHSTTIRCKPLSYDNSMQSHPSTSDSDDVKVLSKIPLTVPGALVMSL